MMVTPETPEAAQSEGPAAGPGRRRRAIRRLAVASLGGVAVLGSAGCVAGDTDPATGVTADRAVLNAHGHTASGGPDYWWWEYATSTAALGTTSDVDVCQSGETPEPDNRCGPGRNGSDVQLSTPVSGLKPDTTYHFRFCTQDVAPGSPPVCFRVLSFKTPSYVLDLSWGSHGSGDGQFSSIGGVAADGAGNVYVADSGAARIQRFGSSGSYLAKWGTPGSGDGQFSSIGGVAADGAGNVYVADSGNARIEKFSLSGAFMAKWGGRGSGDGQFTGLTGVSTDTSGNVYVADSGNHRIEKFDSSGHFLTKWGSQGSGDGQFSGGEFSGPVGVAADGSGSVYVADPGNARIEKFDTSGHFLAKWGVGDATAARTYVDNVATDSSGGVFVTKYTLGATLIVTVIVEKYSSSGTLLSRWVTKTFQVSFGGGPTPTEYVAADRNGNVYIADVENSRIEKFRPAR